MATQHTMKRAQLYTHAQQHSAPQARAHTSTAVQHGAAPQAHWDFPGIASLRRFREDLKTTWERWGRPLGQHIKTAIHRVARPPAHPPRSVSPPPVGGGAGSGARPAPRPTPQTGGLSVCHTLTPPQRGESNAGVEIPMMALPNDSAIASLPAVMPSSTLYRASPDAD